MSESPEEALHWMNVWYESYRCAYLGWCNLVACVSTALSQLGAGEIDAARLTLEVALRDHSPPPDG